MIRAVVFVSALACMVLAVAGQAGLAQGPSFSPVIIPRARNTLPRYPPKHWRPAKTKPKAASPAVPAQPTTPAPAPIFQQKLIEPVQHVVIKPAEVAAEAVRLGFAKAAGQAAAPVAPAATVATQTPAAAAGLNSAVVLPNVATGDNDWVPAQVTGEQARVNSESIASNAEALTTLAKRIAHNKWLHGNSMKAINAIIAQMTKDELNLQKRRMYIKDLQKAVKTLISGTKSHMDRITVLEAKVPAIMGELIKSAAKVRANWNEQKEHTVTIKNLQKLGDELADEVHADQKAVAAANKLAKKTRDALVTAVKVLATRIGVIEEMTNKQIILSKTLAPREEVNSKLEKLNDRIHAAELDADAAHEQVNAATDRIDALEKLLSAAQAQVRTNQEQTKALADHEKLLAAQFGSKTTALSRVLNEKSAALFGALFAKTGPFAAQAMGFESKLKALTATVEQLKQQIAKGESTARNALEQAKTQAGQIRENAIKSRDGVVARAKLHKADAQITVHKERLEHHSELLKHGLHALQKLADRLAKAEATIHAEVTKPRSITIAGPTEQRGLTPAERVAAARIIVAEADRKKDAKKYAAKMDAKAKAYREKQAAKKKAAADSAAKAKKAAAAKAAKAEREMKQLQRSIRKKMIAQKKAEKAAKKAVWKSLSPAEKAKEKALRKAQKQAKAAKAKKDKADLVKLMKAKREAALKESKRILAEKKKQAKIEAKKAAEDAKRMKAEAKAAAKKAERDAKAAEKAYKKKAAAEAKLKAKLAVEAAKAAAAKAKADAAIAKAKAKAEAVKAKADAKEAARKAKEQLKAAKAAAKKAAKKKF